MASNDGTVKMIDVETGEFNYLPGHPDAVQSVVFDKAGQYLLSAGSDGTMRIWS